MGYHITLSRPTPQPEISEQEWSDFVRARSELTSAKASELNTVFVNKDTNLVLHYVDGSVFTTSPDGPQIIKYMVSIAPHFGGVVKGDEGEVYATEADCGTEADWHSPDTPVAWWKRELPRGARIVVGIILGLGLIAILEFSKKN